MFPLLWSSGPEGRFGPFPVRVKAYRRRLERFPYAGQAAGAAVSGHAAGHTFGLYPGRAAGFTGQRKGPVPEGTGPTLYSTRAYKGRSPVSAIPESRACPPD